MPAWKMISEYVWNGLDEQATVVDVILRESHLGGIESIEIHDNGNGIDFNNPQENFGKFDDSSKKDFTKKGCQGRGRYSFHKFATKATWYTRHNKEDAIFEIHDSNLKNYKFSQLSPDLQKERVASNCKGTSVYLSDIPKKKAEKIPSAQSIADSLARVIGWKLIINSNLQVKINGIVVKPPVHELLEETITIGENTFIASIIRWIDKPEGENSYSYYLDSTQKEKTKTTTGFNYKNEFYLSSYIRSVWFDNFQKSDDRNTDMFIDENKSDSSPEFRKLCRTVRGFSNEIYHDFLRSRAKQVVDDFESKGYFP